MVLSPVPNWAHLGSVLAMLFKMSILCLQKWGPNGVHNNETLCCEPDDTLKIFWTIFALI